MTIVPPVSGKSPCFTGNGSQQAPQPVIQGAASVAAVANQNPIFRPVPIRPGARPTSAPVVPIAERHGPILQMLRGGTLRPQSAPVPQPAAPSTVSAMEKHFLLLAHWITDSRDNQNPIKTIELLVPILHHFPSPLEERFMLVLRLAEAYTKIVPMRLDLAISVLSKELPSVHLPSMRKTFLKLLGFYLRNRDLPATHTEASDLDWAICYLSQAVNEEGQSNILSFEPFSSAMLYMGALAEKNRRSALVQSGAPRS